MGQERTTSHAVLAELAYSAQRGERCLWVTELATATGLTLRETVQAVETLYRAGLAQPYFSDREARRAASCATPAGLGVVGEQVAAGDSAVLRQRNAEAAGATYPRSTAGSGPRDRRP